MIFPGELESSFYSARCLVANSVHMSRKGCLNRKDILFWSERALFGHKIANTKLTNAYVL